MMYRIRPASVEDAADLAALYAPYVTDTTISFEYDAPDAAEMARRVARTSERFAYLVAEDAATGQLAGYAYYGELRSRPAYAWSAETSIYLAPEHQGHGLGRTLLQAIERLMAAQGIALSVACITSTNTGSIAFHEAAGYRLCGTFDNCAFKLGSWLSVTWMEKQLLPCTKPAVPVRRLARAEVEAAAKWACEQLG